MTLVNYKAFQEENLHLIQVLNISHFFSKLLDIHIMSNFDAGFNGFRSPKLKEFTKDNNTTCVFLCTVMFKKCTTKFFETRKIRYV